MGQFIFFSDVRRNICVVLGFFADEVKGSYAD